MILCHMQLMQARVMANLTCDVNIIEKCHCILINMSMYNNVMYNYVQHYAIEMIKNDICNVYVHE